jgi:hypothetical protein
MDYMDEKNIEEEEEKQHNQSFIPSSTITPDSKAGNFKQLDMFMDSRTVCSHKDTMWDTGMEKTYCLECFNYIDEKDAYYSNHLSQGRGYY